MFRYAVTIFLSAFLLFQVQPLIAKVILPWFGGTPAVWTTCMLFFQTALLGGYAYAHFISASVTPRARMVVHIGLLLGSLYFLPIIPHESWKPDVGVLPIKPILLLLLATIGLPYFLLSTTGPLLQDSYRRETGHTPYRLYSLSNIGSLLALLTYPFVFEPVMKLQTQIWLWSASYVAFVLFCIWCSLSFSKPPHPSALSLEADVVSSGQSAFATPSLRAILLWLALAACGSALLLATTNQLCQEVTSVPFLWVLPLSLYLITFIICFDHERWYHRNAFLVLLVLGVTAACYALYRGEGLDLRWQLATYSFALWVCCMVCHGELVRAKPAAHYATLFYLMVSLGGVIGGLLVAVGAPLVLNDFWEYHIAVVATVFLAFVVTARRAPDMPVPAWLQRIAGIGLTAVAALAILWVDGGLGKSANSSVKNLETMRNFYGVLRVNERNDLEEPLDSRKTLFHGRIQHGFQFTDPERSRWPTSYFGRTSGIGVAIEKHPGRTGRTPMQIGVVGLGCGTLSVYGRRGDWIRFYEINDEVIRVANQVFTYRKDVEGKGVNIVFVSGDARIRMEREFKDTGSRNFDLLAIDAFSSDAIPMHLLTKESVDLYKSHLKPDGILCMHITNRFLDLTGVVRGIAKELGYECALIQSEADDDLGLKRARWVILTTNREFLDQPEVQAAITPWTDKDPPPIVWTDDYASLWQALVTDKD